MVCKGDGTMEVCTAGYSCMAIDKSPEPLRCPAGKKCPDGKAALDCDVGSYSLEGSAFCTVCPRGKWCPNKDHEPLDCPDGYYQSNTG